ncbi:type 1 glutamine amidotransferase domain-containing protein [Agrococcus sp. SGAir0287]|uniref:type 1 glutamine amidotransferase domain-containing protein n=1 Tax=Agrococcus sp. SGAir0287 TaxID=2070347 RepID=UPI0010CCC815|nr:type 1 glutamine amidotransferase domain-containing protein [Agrococcus sp. SGAir0287]QCR19119.1 type 1 glutamine amidotransferase domain-containing protein [Agrococcus sp. SGAir0287]
MAKRVLHVVTTVDRIGDARHPTGLWLTELTHAWQVFEEAGFEQLLVSSGGSAVPLDPRSLAFPALDATAKAWQADTARMALLQRPAAPAQIDAGDFDAILYAGGHGAMVDLPADPGLQRLAASIWEHGGVVASVCHGVCGLLDVSLPDGSLLVGGRRLTGFSSTEERLARLADVVPFDVEAALRERGARYAKAVLPMVPYVVTDGRLVTGQNPASANTTARRVVEVLAAS